MDTGSGHTPPDVSIILVSWNTRELLVSCLASLAAAIGDLSAETWVVDNGSTDESAAAVQAQFPYVQLIENRTNLGFAGANNQAIQASTGRYVLLLNSDTIASAGAIRSLVRFADQRPAAAAVGAMLLNADGSFQASFFDFPTLRSELLNVTGLGRRLVNRNYPSYSLRHSQVARLVDWLPGACMLVRRTALAQVGLMDEGYFMYSEETDWCLRLRRAGWQIWYHPEVRIVHLGGQSTQQRRQPMVRALYRSKLRFFRKHYGPASATILQLIFVVVLSCKWLISRLRYARHAGVEMSPLITWSDLEYFPTIDSTTLNTTP